MNAPKSHYINHCSCEKESEPLFWTYGKVKPLQCFKCCSYVFIIATISPMPTTGYLTPIGWQARMKLLWSWPQSAICSPRSCQLHWHINHLWFSDHSKHLKKAVLGTTTCCSDPKEALSHIKARLCHLQMNHAFCWQEASSKASCMWAMMLRKGKEAVSAATRATQHGEKV